MISIHFSELCTVVLGESIKDNNCEVTGVSIHTCLNKSEGVFVCINSAKYKCDDGSLGFTNNEDSVYGLGGHQDGHTDIPQAIQKGAKIIIIDDINYFNPNLNAGFILVDDSLEALKRLSAYHISKSKTKVVAITGSTGKTTTTHIVYEVLSMVTKIEKIHRIRNSILAMCIEILNNISFDTDFLVVEMQVDGYGQIDRFCEIVKPDISVITNINLSHYVRFNSEKDILNEKLGVYRNLKPTGIIFINDDNDLLHNWSALQNDKRIIKVSIKKQSDVYLKNSSVYGESNFNLFDLSVMGKEVKKIFTQTTGVGMLYSILFAFAIANHLGMCLTEMKNNIMKIKSPIGRFNCFEGLNKSEIIIDSYNASYISMVQGIEYVSKIKKLKKILILGSMLELGDKTESQHRALGRFIDDLHERFFLITFGEAAMYIATEIKNIPTENIFCAFCYEDIIETLHHLNIDKDTIVFIKGSGGMRMELMVPYLLSSQVF